MRKKESSMKHVKRILALILALALVASLAACGSGTATEETTADDTAASADTGDSTVIRIGYLPITHALAVFEEKELLDSEDDGITIELEKFSSWSDLTDALNAGRIDGASVLIELAMSAVSQGIDLKAVALGHRDGNVIVVNDDIQSAEDLAGKTLAIPHTQSSHNILLNDALAQASLTIDDVTVVQLAPSEMPSSLASGAIDGYCVAEPFGAQAVYQGFGHVLYNSEDLWEDSLCCGLVLNGAAIESLGADKVDTLIQKYYEAGNALTGDTATQIAETYLGQDEEVLEVSLQWIHYDDLAITEEAYNTLVEKVIAYGINDNPPSYADFVYQSAQ
jgi:NitT/TauT family transport system substrate-binding protein